MRRFAVYLLLLWLIAVPATAVRIVEFCPDPWLSGEDDEFIVLQGEGSLAGVRLTDGEGGLRFPEGASIQGRLVLARRADAYRTVHGTLPDWECFDTLEAVPDVIRSGDFRLANRGDELRLLRGTVVLQTVTWPGDVVCREGQVHYREDGTWDPRVLAIGQSRFAPETFRNASVTAFVSPDAACTVFSRAVADADERILVNVYEMTHPEMANALIRARERGVSVTVLLEGGPVGGIPGGEEEIAGTMTASGIPVLAMTGTDTVHARYRYDHAKYLVVDGDTVLVTTENFKQSGFPVDGGYGNRGWGAAITHPGVARYFESVFWADAGGGDITAFSGAAGTALYGTPATPATGRHAPAEFTDVTVTPVLSPDTSDLIPALIGNATATIEIQQASITNTSDGRLNPYLAAAVNASRAGVRVRVLLDSAWFNTDGDEDNDEMVALINGIARREGVLLAGRCADLEAMQAAKIHTKGIIVDGRSVAISSINWNDNSPRFNREAGVILDSPGVAGYFTAVFEEDWASGQRMVPDGGTTTDLLRYAALAAVIGGVALLGWHRHLR